MIDSVEQLLNWVSDQDAEWWPFLFLRPREEERLTSARLAALSLLYGAMVGAVANLIAALAGQHVSPFVFPVGITVGLFVIFRATFAVAWNRRAARLVPAPVAVSVRNRGR